jgi:hypothetical protein
VKLQNAITDYIRDITTKKVELELARKTEQLESENIHTL